MRAMANLVGVDLGGTNIRAALFTSNTPPPTTIAKHPTPASDGVDAVIQCLIETIDEVLKEGGSPSCIGIGAPGPLDPKRGVILYAPNLPGWHDVPLADRIGHHFQAPVVVGNDANLAALGEWRHGAGDGVSDMIYLTISTGIGGGVIIDEKLLLGANGLGAELGHVTIDPDGPICSCGQPGHIEALASGTALARRAVTQLESGTASSLRAIWETSPLSARHVGQAAEEGDDLASRLVEETGKMIGRYLADLSHIFNPKTIVLGGGVTQIGELLFQPIRTAVKKYALSSEYYQELEIVPASLGDDAGLIGAMVLASMQ